MRTTTLIDVPEGFEPGAAPGALLVAVDPLAASPLHASVSVVAQELPPGGVTLDEYTTAGLEAAAARFERWRLIDRAETTIAGVPAARTLATYLASFHGDWDGEWVLSVALEQWVVVHAGHAWVVSCTCDSADYAALAERWIACAESLRVEEPPA